MVGHVAATDGGKVDGRLRLYELAAADDERRFSPYCWRVRLALTIKGLHFTGVPWRYAEKEAIAFSGQGRVPVLTDGDRVVVDSWDIACYLEDAYPGRPSLFGGAAGRALSRFYADWTEAELHARLVRLLLVDIHRHLHEKDRAYFRATREDRFGKALEEVCPDRQQAVASLTTALTPLERTLARQPFLGGGEPLFADCLVLGAFLWAWSVSPVRLLDGSPAVARWRERLFARVRPEASGLKLYACG